MEYIVSRNYIIDDEVLEKNVFFTVWGKKMPPYDKLGVGDIIYWYDRQSNKINFKTKIVKLRKFNFNSRNELLQGINNFFRHLQGEEYLKTKGDKGFCLCYKIKKISQVNFYRPAGIRLPQYGWLEVDKDIKKSWLDADQFRMADESVLSRLANRDLTRKIKEKYGCKCQFPGCGIRIKTKTGYYAEVAHIVPVRDSGKTAAGNLIVLCPNHHKEFDFGELTIDKCDKNGLKGVLNNKKFTIKF